MFSHIIKMGGTYDGLPIGSSNHNIWRVRILFNEKN